MKFLTKRLIGKSDKADFPRWNLRKLPVKIDSGAYRCSIDCFYTKLVKKDKKKVLKYILLREDHPLFTGEVIETEDFKTSKVKSSNGENEKRFIVKTDITLFGETYTTEFSLSNRPDMRFPVLLGRKLLNKKFIIDTSKTNLSINSKKRKINF